MAKKNIHEEKRISDEQTRELQKYILDMLLAIDQVCREHNLCYYLIAGTMLGAVRHKGFVPWDDDADVALPRKDYNEFVKHANEWLPKRYELVSGLQDPMYPYQFARIQDKETTYILRRKFNFVGGLPVDVFPLDGMTTDEHEQRKHYRRYAIAKKLLYYSTIDPLKHGYGLHWLFAKFMHKVVSQDKAHRRMNDVQREYNYDASSLIADHDNKPERGILPKEVYGTPTPVEFEGHTLMGVQKPDEYLRYCYGDYMKMPKQLPPQNFRYLDLHTPYREYMRMKKK